MIQIKDFRIGNYILVDAALAKVTLLNDDPGFADTPCLGFTQGKESGFEQCSSERVQPVPLTDEILKSCSYTFHNHFKLWQHDHSADSYTIELDRDFTALDFSHRPISKNIKYLHSLQNLYYTIMGEELVLKKQSLVLVN